MLKASIEAERVNVLVNTLVGGLLYHEMQAQKYGKSDDLMKNNVGKSDNIRIFAVGKSDITILKLL